MMTSYASNVYSSVKWHGRLGHIRHDMMYRLAREGFLGSLIKVDLPTRGHCLARKLSMKLLESEVPLELVHSNICGLFDVRA